ncbi:MAG: glutamate--tRNA ligase [Alphaproteobacteria bacterium]|nr:glutamate--tRNA ligase [Alphaproteobacteria bacterium]MDY4689038.1 glutamate--tRNA ligase [Alphaproteobacteria bacterium]
MSEIKVRFAPSPTGFMHIGNTRTALFNWLLAKKLGGKFMLRIDDTDRLRSKKEYEDAMRESLVWLGFKWSEEARQSARFDRYNEVKEKLMAEGRIYACYETPEELEIKRKRAMAKGLAPVYDRQALHYTAEDLAKFKAEGRKPHYRFKLLDGVIEWDDIVRGHCRYEAEKLSDPIIIREDGSYLYHLPSCIDDSDFGITHIVRGEDHTTNTASQIQMFEAIGGKVPTFAHLPLLTGTEGKLSKRLGSLGVRELKAEGVEAMAICSFLAKLGTSDAIEPYYSLDELAASLDFTKLGRSQPKFDEEELKHFNTKVVRSMPYSLVKDRIDADETFWNDVRANLDVVDDVKIWEDICHKEVTPIIEDKALTDLAAELLPAETWTENTFNEWMSILKAQSGKKGRELFHPVRKALTALDNGPELKILLPLIGYEKAKKRLLGQKA